MKKLAKIFFILCFFCSFSFINFAYSESFEDGARNKRLGFEDKKHDSDNVTKQRLIRDIELNNLENIILFLKIENFNINFIINGLNPFTHAATVNNLELVKYFLSNTDVNIDITDGLGNSALMHACEKGNVEIVNFLINKGANINFQNKEGLTPIMKAIENNKYYVIKLLLENNVDTTKSDFTGRTINDIAENSRDRRIINLLN